MDREKNGMDDREVKGLLTTGKSQKNETETEQSRDGPKSRDSTWSRAFQTLCIYVCFVSLGLSSGTLGPTLVHVELLYGTDTKGMSLAMIGVCVGYLMGSIFCGIVFDRFNRKLQCALGMMTLGLTLMGAPQSDYIYVFHACITAMAFCQGYIYSGGSPYIIELWRESGNLQAPLMQGIHALWAVGAFSCPFLAVPFLADIPQAYYERTTPDGAMSGNDVTQPSNNISDNHLSFKANSSTNSFLSFAHNVSTEAKNNPTDLHIHDLEHVRFVYILAGGASVITSILFTFAFFLTGPSLFRKQQSPVNSNETKVPNSEKTYNVSMATDTRFKVLFISVMFVYCNVYYWYDYVPGNLLSAFVIKGLHWPADRGALITSMFWGSFGLGRLLGVPVSYFLSPTIMLAFDVVGAAAGFALLGTAAKMSTILVWISAAIVGISTATTLPTAILWTSHYLPINGRLGAMFLIASSTGGLSGAALAGYLFETYTHMWLVYLDFGACVVNAFLFISMFGIVKYFARKHKSSFYISEIAIKVGGTSDHNDRRI